jgi:flagellar motor switch protein FliN/FliY
MSSNPKALEFLQKEFCEAFASVFEQTAGEPYPLVTAETPASASEESLGYDFSFEGCFTGTLYVEVDQKSAAILATRLIGGPTDESVSYLPEHEDAVSEIMNQAGGVMANSLRDQFGSSEIRVEKTTISAGTPVLVLRAENGIDAVSVALLPGNPLLDSIQKVLSVPAPQPEAPQAAPALGAISEQKNLHLIMDVELNLTLRFGKRVLALSEVADLTTGSVVELDRVVDEPVELLLGDRIIARGEVVIVDGNYGLRVTELTSMDHSSLLSA